MCLICSGLEPEMWLGRFFADLSGVKPMQTARGVSFHPIWRAVPALEPLYTRYEKGEPASQKMCWGARVPISLVGHC